MLTHASRERYRSKPYSWNYYYACSFKERGYEAMPERYQKIGSSLDFAHSFLFLVLVSYAYSGFFHSFPEATFI
jgi:hypothetical protein